MSSQLARPVLLAGVAKLCFVSLGLLAHHSSGLYDPVHHIESARLYGNIDYYAYWFTDLLVGTPPQRVSLILDTGSGVCAFPCKSCPHCGKHIDPNFDFAKSSTAAWTGCAGCKDCRSGHCAYHQGYQEGSSITGWWFKDWIRLGDTMQRNPKVFTKLGCHQDENKLFYTQKANGIMGVRGTESVLQALFQDREHIESRVFSICLAEWGGRLVVGGYNESYHRAKILWIPLTLSSFTVPLASMQVSRGRKISGLTKAIVDSGTTYTYMSTAAYRGLRGDIEAHCKSHDCGATLSGTCWTLRSGTLSKFPAVEVSFGSARTKWVPRAYLYRKGTGKQWCYSFMDDGRGATTVLGASWMLHQEIIFDLRSSKLGIVPANCPAYRERPVHSGQETVPPSTDEWNALPRPPPSPFASGQGDIGYEVTAEGDPVFDDEESGFMHFVWVAASIVGCFLVCALGYCGFRWLRRIDDHEHSKPSKPSKPSKSKARQTNMKPMKLGQVDILDSIGEGDVEDDEEDLQLVQNVDYDFGSPEPTTTAPRQSPSASEC